MKIANPTFMATEEILWLKADGTEVLIQALIGIPYKSGNAWACPAALIGVDDRYVDLIGESSLQSLSIALRLIRQRLGHLLDSGEKLAYPDDKDGRWDMKSLDVVFGKI